MVTAPNLGSLMAVRKLTPEEIKQIQAWFISKVPQIQCTVCSTGPLTIEDHIVAPWATTPQGGWHTSIQYPMVQVTCTNCGHVHAFNANVMGVMKPAKAPQVGLLGGFFGPQTNN